MGIFSYTPQKEGKGIRKDEPRLIGPLEFFRIFFNQIWNFFKLNFLFIITSIPIITIPAAISATAYICRCYSTETHAFLFSDYFEYFKKSFLPSLPMFFINLVCAFSLYMVYANFTTMPNLNSFLIPLAIINLILFTANFYFYPLLVTYDIPLWAVYKNALIFALVKFPLNLIIAVLIIAITVGTFIYYIAGILLTLLILPSFLIFLTVFYTHPIIEKNMREE